ncbi:MAG TPA: tetratricopeptide repeat protein [Opitutaceae bacterium]|nr:tetratricopeptide repeat protein [Opitutaceae bacterium]
MVRRLLRRLPPAAWRGGALIFFATFAAYWPAFGAKLIWNDEDYVTKPALTSLRGLAQIWLKVGATQQYYPLLHTAFWVQHRLWGDAPLGYHLANVLFHALSACLFAGLLRRLDLPAFGCWLAGLLFALHPICVESVAWVSEEKNTFSLIFYLLAAWAYFDFDRDRRGRQYAAASGLFLASILSKSLNATLPGALLVVLWWRRGRLSWRRDVAPLLPWMAAGAADGLFTGWVEKHFLGAQGSLFALGFLQRLLVAGRTFWFYLGKIVWPSPLIFIYPKWAPDPGVWWQWLFPLAALGLLAALAVLAARSRAPLAAALFFAGSLFPTSGFLTVFGFLFSFVADHWAYLPSLGIVALAAAGWERATRGGARRLWRWAVPAAVLAAFSCLTWRQTRLYADAETLYNSILARNPGAWMAHINLGIILHEQRRDAEALAHDREAVRLAPDYPQGHNDLGNALLTAGRPAEALAEYRRAIELWPAYSTARINLGNVLRDSGHLEEAVSQYRLAIQADPDSAQAYNSLGIAFGQLRRPEDSIEAFRHALRLYPAYAQAHYDLAVEFDALGRPAEALPEFAATVALAPNFLDGQKGYGLELARQKRYAEALEHFQEAVRIDPRDAQAQYALSLMLRLAGREDEARAHYGEAMRLQGKPAAR